MTLEFNHLPRFSSIGDPSALIFTESFAGLNAPIGPGIHSPLAGLPTAALYENVTEGR